ncbi:MAG: serine hydrolase domain-containing protein [Litorimonas sp.]
MPTWKLCLGSVAALALIAGCGDAASDLEAPSTAEGQPDAAAEAVATEPQSETQTSGQTEGAPLSARIQPAVESIVAQADLVGLAVKVVVDGEVVGEAVTGTRTMGSDVPLSLDDRYHMGSIGKSMTSTIIATLVEDGTMRWDDRLGDHLGDVEMEDGWRDVTLEQLLTHRSGVPAAPQSAFTLQATGGQALADARRQVAATVLGDAPATEPGTAFAYSNEGYLLASIMAETATGQPWESLVRTRLAEPLGLNSLGFGAPTGDDAPRGHRGTKEAKVTAEPTLPGADNPRWMAAAGTLHMTLDDLVRYGMAHAQGGDAPDAILSQETFDRLHTAQLGSYGYGWVVQEVSLDGETEPLIWHNGSNTMWYSLIGVLPERDTVIVMSTNDGTGLATTQGALDQLMRSIIGLVASQE